MIILGADTTGLSMSVAITKGDTLLGELFLNNGLKHSQTFMPAVEQLVDLVGVEKNEIDAFAVAIGPGSFTGIRIGVSAIAAMAFATQKPVYAVNTLDALMENLQPSQTVCAVMDARRGEVYTSAMCKGEYIVQDQAIPLTELLEQIKDYKNAVFVGDAAKKYKDDILRQKPDSLFANEPFILQRASSVCMCAIKGCAEKKEHNQLKPHYLRKSQAERMKGK